MGDLNNALGKEWKPNRKHNSFCTRVEDELGYQHIMTKSEYDGNYTESTKKYKTTVANYEKTKKQLQSMLNFYGYSIIQDCDGIDDYTGEPMKYFTFEVNYNDEIDYSKDPVFYHAAPTQSVNKILKQGLVPKDRKKLDLSRPNRVYLLRTYDDSYFQGLSRKEGQFVGTDWDYTVLKVDLSGMQGKVHLYKDPYSDEGKAFYTSDNIPPSCLSVPTQKKQVLMNNREKVSKLLTSTYSFLKVENSSNFPDILYISGSYDNPSTAIVTQFNFSITVSTADCYRLQGKKTRYFPSKRITIKPIGSNEHSWKDIWEETELMKFLKSFIGAEMKQKKAAK